MDTTTTVGQNGHNDNSWTTKWTQRFKLGRFRWRREMMEKLWGLGVWAVVRNSLWKGIRDFDHLLISTSPMRRIGFTKIERRRLLATASTVSYFFVSNLEVLQKFSECISRLPYIFYANFCFQWQLHHCIHAVHVLWNDILSFSRKLTWRYEILWSRN